MIIRSHYNASILSYDAPTGHVCIVSAQQGESHKEVCVSERKVFGESLRVLLEFAAAACLAVVLGLFPTTAAAQVLYGSITGTVTDSSGAAIPGATVNIKDEQTGLALSAVTDSTGTYTIRNVT